MIVSGSEDGKVFMWRTDHDWYNPGKNKARITGYSRDKNDSYETFEATDVSACTGTAFMPFMTSIRDAVKSSAKRKLAQGIITDDEFAMIMMSQAKHDMKMCDNDEDQGGGFSGMTDHNTTSVAIVTSDADGRLKLFVSGCLVSENNIDDNNIQVKAFDVLNDSDLKVAVGTLVETKENYGRAESSPPPPLPISKRPCLNVEVVVGNLAVKEIDGGGSAVGGGEHKNEGNEEEEEDARQPEQQEQAPVSPTPPSTNRFSNLQRESTLPPPLPTRCSSAHMKLKKNNEEEKDDSSILKKPPPIPRRKNRIDK
jgi:hypothetical protein